MTDTSRLQIDSPSPTAVTVSTDQHAPVAKIEVKSQGQDVTITIGDPLSLSDGKEQSASDIRGRFDDECSMLCVFPTRLEFWGHDGFLSSIRGETIEVA